jgi:hypothetical protein
MNMANYWFNSKLGYAPPDWFSTFGNIDPGSPVKPPEFRRLMPLSRPDADCPSSGHLAQMVAQRRGDRASSGVDV